MKYYLFALLLLFTGILIFACQTAKLDMGDITFIALDQFGNAVPDATVTFDNQEMKTDETGQCVFKTSLKQALDSPISVKKDTYQFLGPEKLETNSPKVTLVVLTLFRNYVLTVSALLDKRPFAEVIIAVNGEDKRPTSSGQFAPVEFSGENTTSMHVEAKTTVKKIIIQKSDTTINIAQNQYNYVATFDFQSIIIPSSPPPMQPSTNTAAPPQLEKAPPPAILIINALMSTYFNLGEVDSQDSTRHMIIIKPDQKMLSAFSRGKKITIDLSRLSPLPGHTYNLDLNFMTNLASPFKDITKP